MCTLGWDGITYCYGMILGIIPTYRLGEILVILCGLFALASVYACSRKDG